MSQGQIVIEYVLLMIVAVLLAAMLVSQVVSRNTESPGFLIKKWDQIVRTIGSDPIEK